MTEEENTDKEKGNIYMGETLASGQRGRTENNAQAKHTFLLHITEPQPIFFLSFFRTDDSKQLTQSHTGSHADKPHDLALKSATSLKYLGVAQQ